MNPTIVPMVMSLLLCACKQEEPSTEAEATAASTPPATTAASAEVIHELAGTRWVLMQLGGADVTLASDEREAFIVLNATDQRVQGNGACNRLNGGYQQTETSLQFTQVAATRMACPQMDRESAFLKALESTASWKIEGRRLELFDASGASAATFEERNLQ